MCFVYLVNNDIRLGAFKARHVTSEEIRDVAGVYLLSDIPHNRLLIVPSHLNLLGSPRVQEACARLVHAFHKEACIHRIQSVHCLGHVASQNRHQSPQQSYIYVGPACIYPVVNDYVVVSLGVVSNR